MDYNITLKQMSLSEMKDIYEELMIVDFPPKELKKWEMVENLYKKGIYEALSAFADKELIGYAFFSTDVTHRLYLLDYFAIVKKLRGQGYGSCMLKYISERFKDVDILICEVENPFVKDDPIIKKQKQKRMDFYLNNCWKDTGIDAFMFDVEYRLLYLILGNNLSTSDIQSAYEAIYRAAIRKEELEPNMWLRRHEGK